MTVPEGVTRPAGWGAKGAAGATADAEAPTEVATAAAADVVAFGFLPAAVLERAAAAFPIEAGLAGGAARRS